jgi:LemA protein
MDPAILIIIGIPLFILILIWAMYNGLVKLRYQCRESWADVDTELKRRYDLIPNLVEIVKGYAKHEREVLEDVARLRSSALASSGSPASQAADENKLIQALRQLLVVVERYPDLKADEHFLELQGELANTEDRIQAARRFYNANVRDYNVRVEQFPSNLIAGAFSFKPEEFFEIERVEAAAPQVKV